MRGVDEVHRCTMRHMEKGAGGSMGTARRERPGTEGKAGGFGAEARPVWDRCTVSGWLTSL
jgi:hypothetical protein